MAISGAPAEEEGPNDLEARLDELFGAYRAACPVAQASRDFIPDLWAEIDARRVSTIVGIMTSSANQPDAFFDSTFVEAPLANHASTPEPLRLDLVSELEP